MNSQNDTRIRQDTVGITRRHLLHRGTMLLAAAVFYRPSGLAAEVVSPEMSVLSGYMSKAASCKLPDEVSESTKEHILDTLAAMVSGSQLPPGRAAIKFVRTSVSEQTASVVGTDVVCEPIDAALTNGMLAHADETDDSHAPSQSHPGCAVVPAALAAGEKFAIDGTRFIRAVALGYDVGTRVSMTLGGVDFQAHTHRDSHSYAGVFGAAAAAGSVASLTSQQMVWVLDYAAQQSSGLAAWQRDSDHIEKAFVFGGMPARSGITSALVVKSGWTGVNDIFSGSNNFLLANAPQCDPAGLIEKLGERFEVKRTNIKKWSVGSPIQAPLDATEILVKRHGFHADQVKQVTVRVATEEAVVVDNRDMPDVCLQHMIALMLLDKTVSFRSAHDKQRMSDPDVLRQRAKVQLIRDEELEHRLPRREAIVEIMLVNGDRFREHVEAVRGTAENPMERYEIVGKCRDLISPVLGAQVCNRLIETVLALDAVQDVRELRPLLRAH